MNPDDPLPDDLFVSPPLDDALAARIRHRALRGPARANPVEVALSTGFAVLLVAWGLAASLGVS